MTISQLITLTSLTEEFIVSEEESRVAYRSLDEYNCSMHWHCDKIKLSLIKGGCSKNVIITEKEKFQWPLFFWICFHTYTGCHRCLTDIYKVWLTNSTKQLRDSQLLHISALHAFAVSAGISDICPFRSLPSVSCCVEVHVWQHLCTAGYGPKAIGFIDFILFIYWYTCWK